ncbi:transmembrane channel-like protein 8 isoform X2 [Pyxicephalus adspersus]|uniref:transmembrane channel-like protein 8 isoform X2 n=1 Tax=Pyxicephalus adspersus TaxID=30357 RepID=UPI003B5A4D63
MNDKPPEEGNTITRTWRAKVKYSDLRENPIPMRDKRDLNIHYIKFQALRVMREIFRWFGNLGRSHVSRATFETPLEKSSRGVLIKISEGSCMTADCSSHRKLQETHSTRFWIPFTPKYGSCLRPAWAKSLQILGTLKLWERTLIAIRGKFGSSISSYFSFLRFLMLMNFTSLILTTSLVIFPTAFLRGTDHRHATCGNSTSSPNRSRHNVLLDIFSGTGVMEDTYLFYGYYSEMTGAESSFNTRVAYLLTPLIFLSVCSLGLLQCTVKGITQRRIRTRDYRTPISIRVFAGWDFCVQGAGTSVLKQRSLSIDLKSHLAEELWFWRNTQISTSERIRVLILRVLLNCLILAMMASGFYCIYIATGISQDYQEKSGSLVAGLVIQYLAPIVISLVLLILPQFFMLLVKFEGHSPRTEIALTLIRCVFLRLGTLGIFFFSLGQKILCLGGSLEPCKTCGYNSQFKCWETSLGQEFYKLSVFHFLELLMEFLLIQLPRRFLVSKSRFCFLRWLGKEKFRLSQNVLDTVYSQTLVMGGMFYVPLLPLLNLVFIFITFYIKKYSLYHLCDVSKKLYRASTLRIIFCFVLLLGLMTVFLPLLYLVTSIRPSHSCGPFADYTTPWEAVQNSTRSVLPPEALAVLRYATSETSAYTLLFVLCLTLTSLASRVHQNEKDVEQLRDLLSNQIEDRKFLVRRLKEAEDGCSQEAENELHSL